MFSIEYLHDMTDTDTHKGRGFTLIELIMVISIIGMLSSIVLVSLKNAQIQAKNSVATQIAQKYGFAIEAFYAEHGYYPNNGNNGNMDGSVFNTYCLGRSRCDFGSRIITDNPKINAEISEYLANLSPIPVSRGVISSETLAGVDFLGPYYACSTGGGGVCDRYVLMWHLDGENFECNYGENTFWLSFRTPFPNSVLAMSAQVNFCVKYFEVNP